MDIRTMDAGTMDQSEVLQFNTMDGVPALVGQYDWWLYDYRGFADDGSYDDIIETRWVAKASMDRIELEHITSFNK